jgi:hypothetical protein
MEELEEMEPGFAISYNRHDRPLYTSEYDSEYDEESSEYDSKYTTEGSHSEQGKYDSEDDLDRTFQVEERKRRNRWIKRKLHKSNSYCFYNKHKRIRLCEKLRHQASWP